MFFFLNGCIYGRIERTKMQKQQKKIVFVVGPVSILFPAVVK